MRNIPWWLRVAFILSVVVQIAAVMLGISGFIARDHAEGAIFVAFYLLMLLILFSLFNRITPLKGLAIFFVALGGAASVAEKLAIVPLLSANAKILQIIGGLSVVYLFAGFGRVGLKLDSQKLSKAESIQSDEIDEATKNKSSS